MADPTIDEILAPHRDRIAELLRLAGGAVLGMALVILEADGAERDFPPDVMHGGRIVALVPTHVASHMIMMVPPSLGDALGALRSLEATVLEGRLPIFISLRGLVALSAATVASRTLRVIDGGRA